MLDLTSTTNDVTVQVSVLPTGQLGLLLRWIFENEQDTSKVEWFPDYSFLIEHPSGKRVMFDLGMRKALEEYPPIIRSTFELSKPTVEREAFEILQQDGHIQPNDIHHVVLSHLHWDHIGDISTFPNAELIIGPEAKALAAPGYPSMANSPFNEDTILKAASIRELSYDKDNWEPLGPFPKALDLFKDKSFYLLDTPGHMKGHLGGLARTGKDEYVFMGGDCCHHRRLLTDNNAEISFTCGPAGMPGFHADLPAAKVTIDRVKQLDRDDKVLVVLAHDNTIGADMPLYPQVLNGWKDRGSKYTHSRKL